MLALINRILDWIKSLFWKEEMELTLVGLQYSGKTTFVNVIAVSYHKTIICVVEWASLFWVTQCLVRCEAFQSDQFDMKFNSRDGNNQDLCKMTHHLGGVFVLLLLTHRSLLYVGKPFVFFVLYSVLKKILISNEAVKNLLINSIMNPEDSCKHLVTTVCTSQ